MTVAAPAGRLRGRRILDSLWGASARQGWLRYPVALVIVGLGAALRVAVFSSLGTRIAYLTFYPAVVIAALYGGLPAGVMATAASGVLAYLWIQKATLDYAGWLALGFFLVVCVGMSAVAGAMLRAQERVRQRTAELMVARDQAQAASQAKSAFLASMSHELRTPLNAILGFSGLLTADVDIPADQRTKIGIINRSGEHLLGLINQLLDIAKIEARRTTLEVAPFDLGQLVRDVSDLMSDRARAKGLLLVLDESSQFPGFVKGDAAKVRQILINLVGNAIKFTDEGGVTLRLDAAPADSPDQTRLTIEVEDTGVGISADDQARIFEPFVQVGIGVASEGTGLGLAITREYAELMGGRVNVQSVPGTGSRFQVEIMVGHASESEVAGADRAKVSRLTPGQPECRVLVVEDQMENRVLLQGLLEDAGFRVKVAEDGYSGIAAFLSWRPHFIWMDIRMPGMDGTETAIRIRALDHGEDVKIAALTASVFDEQRGEVMAAGLDDFVRKPYRPSEIFACMERHLGVNFTHMEVPDAADGKSAEVSAAAEALMTLPQELREELAKALTRTDGVRIAAAVRRIGLLDPVGGQKIADQVERLEYTPLLRALRFIENNSTREGP